MGEVYRARDSRLGREVAIKVLPQHLSANPEIRSRFEREAKTVSSLNHPNICTLFDVGREGETDYLVMELVEGETLAQRLTRGALPGAEVLKIGAQIADALDRAHRAGVVHRDLKPGNVMLTKSGAKLMDFGLARATGLAGQPGSSAISAALSHSPTVAAPLTAEGTIVGTFQYMSPEQLEGSEADARSDLWALGCVLYEMATGRRAFEGRSQASLISAIMSGEPAPASLLTPTSPPALDRLIGRCLAKDPDDRWQTARDLMHELRAIGAPSTSVSGTAAVPAAKAAAARSSPLPWVIAAVALIAALALGFVVLSQRRTPDASTQLSLLPPEGSLILNYGSLVSISPDGRSVAYCAADSGTVLGVYYQSLDAPRPVRIMRTEGLTLPFWAPDGRTIGLLDLGNQQLLTIPVGGGSPTVLCATHSGRGATWSRQGVIVFAPSSSGPLFRVPATGGQMVQASWPDSSRHESAHRFPYFLPDGEHFLFASLPAEDEGFPIYVGSLNSHEARRIMFAASAVTYAEPGYLIFRRAGKVMAQAFDVRALKVKGNPVALADAPPMSDLDAEPVAQASRDGRLIMLDARTPDTQLQWFDRNGERRGTLSLPAGKWGRPVLSPDDRFAALINGDDLWTVDLVRSVAVRLTSSGLARPAPVWSPDGKRIAFTESHGREEIMLINADGSGRAEQLATTSDLFKEPMDWRHEGLVFVSIARTTFRDIWLANVGGGAAPVPLIQTSFAEGVPRVSPDGRWIAYLSSEAGHDDVYIQSFPAPGHKVRVSTDGASLVWWMPGSDEVCYRTIDEQQMMSVKLTRQGNDLVVGQPQVLFRFPPGAIGTDFSHDGQRVLANVAQSRGQGNTARVILNWTALLKR
jgi:serine/threonine protein kinase